MHFKSRSPKKRVISWQQSLNKVQETKDKFTSNTSNNWKQKQ